MGSSKLTNRLISTTVFDASCSSRKALLPQQTPSSSGNGILKGLFIVGDQRRPVDDIYFGELPAVSSAKGFLLMTMNRCFRFATLILRSYSS
jgi:hypothetical protein